MSFTMKTLTEGIRQRHMGAQHQRLTEKWNRTGLLRGLTGYSRENMSVMLENQAAQLLRETNSLGGGASGSASSGDIRGFQNVAFPIVRRVFGGLVANELVSIQPMSLPSGLLFYLDYTYGADQGGDGTASVYTSGQSIYNNPVGKGIQSGSLAQGGQYDLLGSGYSRRHGLTQADQNFLSSGAVDAGTATAILSVTAAGVASTSTGWTAGGSVHTELTGAIGRLCDFDADIVNAIALGTIDGVSFAAVPAKTSTTARKISGTGVTGVLADYDAAATGVSGYAADLTMIKDIAMIPDSTPAGDSPLTTAQTLEDPCALGLQSGTKVLNIRRLNKLVRFDSNNNIVVDPLGGSHVLMVLVPVAGLGQYPGSSSEGADNVAFTFPLNAILDVDSQNGALTVPTFESALGNGADHEAAPVIPEIDIKIESLAVTAVSRKLKAKWSPELAQDLNAYHSLDAEVELTQILSEQIALEIDREVLNDLLTQANGANLFWSRAPGKFVNKVTGVEVPRNTSLRPGPQFTGTVRDWYETLTETIIDAANTIHRKTLRGSANFIVIGPDVATILEASVMYKPSYTLDGEGQASALSIGAEKIGNLSNRFTVYKDPYFPRNKILVGYKGGSYLETGYVYAPYVPLIVTPTIFAPEDFTPRKGVMTRYGKKMVRSDFYGTVTCMDMNII